MADAQAQDAAFRQAVQQAAGSSTGAADELAKLGELRANGTISDAEFERLKAGIVGG